MQFSMDPMGIETKKQPCTSWKRGSDRCIFGNLLNHSQGSYAIFGKGISFDNLPRCRASGFRRSNWASSWTWLHSSVVLGRFFATKPTNILPIGSMYFVYLPTFTIKNQLNVGEYTILGMGCSIFEAKYATKCRRLKLCLGSLYG